MQQRMKGGALLAEGRYGCAFDPPLLCKQKQPKSTGHKVGKLTTTPEASKEEMITQWLKERVEGAEDYFVLIEAECTPKPRAQQKEPSLDECTLLEREPMSKTRQLVMPFAGKPLKLVVKSMNVLNFFKTGQHLLEAGALLLTAGICHYDLHVYNVLLDKPNHPRLIDFGMAWQPEAISLANVGALERVFAPQISHQTPECGIQSVLADKLSVEYAIAETQDKKLPLQLLRKLTGKKIQDQIQELRDFVRSSISIQEHNWFSFFTLYWSKFDAWAFGVILATLFTDLLVLDPRFEIDPTVLKRRPMVELVITGLLRCDPGKRLDAAEALELWAPDSPVLQRPEVKKWLNHQKEIRLQLQQKIGTL